jgi:hypothetical protein
VWNRSLPGAWAVASLRPLLLLPLPPGHGHWPRQQPLHRSRQPRVAERRSECRAVRPPERPELRGLLLSTLWLTSPSPHSQWLRLGHPGRIARRRAIRASLGSHLLVFSRSLVLPRRGASLLRWLRGRVAGFLPDAALQLNARPVGHLRPTNRARAGATGVFARLREHTRPVARSSR